jgi:hypothetical protein
MRSATSVLKFYYHLKLALFYAKDFLLENPSTIFANLFKGYIDKIKWIYTNTITSIELNKNVPDVIEVLKDKWNSDVFAEMSVIEKITLLNDEQMNTLDALIDEIIKGEKIEVEFIQEQKVC